MVKHSVPGGPVVSVHTHTFQTLAGPIDCWTYVSEGLARLGQKEVVLSIKRMPDGPIDGYPREPFELFAILHHFASDGRTVDVGSFTVLDPGSPGLLGDVRLRGIAYTLPEHLDDLPLPSPRITALVLTQGELDVALQFGLVRLMSQLGLGHRYFPTAAWLEHGRADVVSPAMMEHSMLAKVGRGRVSGARAYQRAIETRRIARPPTGSLENNAVTFARQEVVLELTPEGAQGVRELLRQSGLDQALALILSPDPEADACFVWMPGQTAPNAISSPAGTGLRISGNHVLIVPGQTDDEVSILEDGFALLLSDTTWHELGRVLDVSPQNWGMPVSKDMGFRVKVS